MVYVYYFEIVYCDIKLYNILIWVDGIIKVIDFGIVIVISVIIIIYINLVFGLVYYLLLE